MTVTRVQHQQRHANERAQMHREWAGGSTDNVVCRHTVYWVEDGECTIWAEFRFSQDWVNHFGDFCGPHWYHRTGDNWQQVVERPGVGHETVNVEPPDYQCFVGNGQTFSWSEQ